ncbi:hypothetical protein UT300009_29830 [Paraclostridium bifermentans]
MRLVEKKVGELGVVRDLPNTLDTFQEIVGGYIEVFSLTDEIMIVLNEEGKVRELEPNIEIPYRSGYTEVIVGNIAFVSSDGEDFASLTDKHIEQLTELGILPKKEA